MALPAIPPVLQLAGDSLLLSRRGCVARGRATRATDSEQNKYYYDGNTLDPCKWHPVFLTVLPLSALSQKQRALPPFYRGRALAESATVHYTTILYSLHNLHFENHPIPLP